MREYEIVFNMRTIGSQEEQSRDATTQTVYDDEVAPVPSIVFSPRVDFRTEFPNQDNVLSESIDSEVAMRRDRWVDILTW